MTVKLPPITIQDVVTPPQNGIPNGVQMINAPEIWGQTKGKGIVVAVLDTGCATDHPDLQGQIIGGKNFTNDWNADPNNFYDNNFHGTHVAGTIAANNFGSGIVGVAPECQLLIGKVLDSRGGGDYATIIQGIFWAVDWRGPNGERARVISLSLGGPYYDDQLHEAVRYAVKNGVVVVCASGNSGDGSTDTDEISYPSYFDEVVEVGAVDINKQLARFSDTNVELDCVALGVDVYSLALNGGYQLLSGTSMATPHVSGAVALLIALHEQQAGYTMYETEIVELLLSNTVDLGIDKRGEGNGLVVLKSDQSFTPPVAEALTIIPQGNNFTIGTFTSKEDAEKALITLQNM